MKILAIEDSPFEVACLRGQSPPTWEFDNVSSLEASQQLDLSKYDRVILDLSLDDVTAASKAGRALLQKFIEKCPVPLVICSGHDEAADWFPGVPLVNKKNMSTLMETLNDPEQTKPQA